MVANAPISGTPDAGPLTGTELFAAIQAGINVKVSSATLKAYAAAANGYALSPRMFASTDDDVSLQAAINAASQPDSTHVITLEGIPRIDLNAPLSVLVPGIIIVGNGAISSGLSTIKNDIMLHYNGAGADGFTLGTDNGLPVAAGGTIRAAVSTDGGTKVQYTCTQGHGLVAAGNTVTVANIVQTAGAGDLNVTGVAVTDIVDVYNFKVANTTARTYTSGGTMTAVNSNWDGADEGFSLLNIRLLVAAAQKGTPLAQKKADTTAVYGNYGIGTSGIRDLRGGSVVLANVFMDGFDVAFNGSRQSDQNSYRDFTTTHCHVGMYIGPKSAQQNIQRHFAYHCDFAEIFDGSNNINNIASILGQTNGGPGGAGGNTHCTLAPVVIGNSTRVGQASIGCAGYMFLGFDFESSNEQTGAAAETTHTDAYVDVGMGHSAGAASLLYPTDANSAADATKLSPFNNQTVGDVTFINPYITTLTAAGGAGKAYVDHFMNVGRCLSVAVHDLTAPFQPATISTVVRHSPDLCDAPTGGVACSATQIFVHDVSHSAYVNMTANRIVQRGAGGTNPFPSIAVVFECPVNVPSGLSRPNANIFPINGKAKLYQYDLPVVSSAPAFNAGTTYGQGAVVSNGGADYVSIQAGNIGHAPPNATWWQPVQGGDIHTDGYAWYDQAGKFVST